MVNLQSGYKYLSRFGIVKLKKKWLCSGHLFYFICASLPVQGFTKYVSRHIFWKQLCLAHKGVPKYFLWLDSRYFLHEDVPTAKRCVKVWWKGKRKWEERRKVREERKRSEKLNFMSERGGGIRAWESPAPRRLWVRHVPGCLTRIF